MSETLTQSLGLDASSALSSLSQLNTAFATFEGHLQRAAILLRDFNAAGNQTSSLLSRLATNATKAAGALQTLNSSNGANLGAAAASYNALGAAVNTAAAKVATGSNTIKTATSNTSASTVADVGKMTTSLQLLSRIAFTQAVVRGLSILRNEIKAVASDAVDLQKKVALIQTIDNSGASADQLKNAIRGISDQFNIPQLQVAEGLYQTISNQIGNATQSVEFMTTAAKLARSTNSSLADSVDLLSGSLKAFNLDVSQAGRAAGVLFKSIDLGRVTATELANDIGRVAPQSQLAGLTLEELASAVAAISVKGTDANQAMTQYRGIVTAIQKPTEAMKEAVEAAGFASTEAAVGALHLTGFLQLLANAAGDSNNKMAAFFPNVRGLSGAAALTSQDMKVLIDYIKQIQGVTSNSIDAKFLTAISTDAERVTSDINKLKNALTDELGQAFLKAGVDISEFVGGVDSLVTIIRVAPPAVIGLAASLGTLATAFGAARLAGLSLAPVLSLLLLTPAAFGAGKSIADFLDEKLFTAQFGKLFELMKQNNQELDAFKDKMKEAADEAKQADDKRVQSAIDATREITAAYNDEVNEATSLNKTLVKGLKADANDIISAYSKLSTAIGTAIADAHRSEENALDKVNSLQNKQAATLLQSQIAGLTDAQKVYALAQKSAQLANDAAAKIASSSGKPGQTKQGEQQAALAEQLAEQGLQIARQVGDRGLVAKAAGDLLTVQNAQIAAEQQLAAAEDKRQAKLAEEKAAVDKVSASIKEQLAIILENSGALDKNGQKFSEAEQAQRAAAREAASNALAKLSLNSADLKQLTDLGLGAAVAKLGSSLTASPLKLAFDADQGIVRVQSQIAAAFADFKVKFNFDTTGLEQSLGKTFSNPDQIFKGMQELADEADKLRRQQDADAASAKAQINLLNQFNIAKKSALANVPDTSSLLGNKNQAAIDANSTIAFLDQIAHKAQLTAEDLKQAQDAVAAFSKASTGSTVSRIQFVEVNNALVVMENLLTQIAEARKGALGADAASGLSNRLQEINSVLEGASRTEGRNFEGAASALQSTVSPAETIANSSATVKANYEAAARAIQQAQSAQGGRTQGFAKGGYVRYLADGGFTPRGTDTIPAMLSPGEFVVNANATRQFYSELVAINSGRSPIYRAEGGPTTTQNFHFGDINLVGDGQRNDARDLVNNIRRELRRTTSNF